MAVKTLVCGRSSSMGTATTLMEKTSAASTAPMPQPTIRKGIDWAEKKTSATKLSSRGGAWLKNSMKISSASCIHASRKSISARPIKPSCAALTRNAENASARLAVSPRPCRRLTS